MIHTLRERLAPFMPGRLFAAADTWLASSSVEHDFESLPPFLKAALKASTAGVVASVVLLGYIVETQLAFYALMGVSLVVYMLARGEKLFGALLDYLTSGKIAWRWAFIVWAILSLLWTSRGRLSVDRAITLVEIQVVGLVFFDAARNLGLSRWILNWVFGCAVVAAAHALLTEDPSVVERLAGLYPSPNMLGMFCVIGLAVFMSIASKPRNVMAIVGLYAAAFFLLGGIVGSASLKGLVGLVLVCGLGAVLVASRKRSGAFIGAAAGLGTLLIIFVKPLRLVWEHALYRAEITLTTFGTTVGVNESVVERTRFIQKGMDLIAESPVFGRGLDTFRWLSDEGTYAHNNVVEIGVALGVVGVVLYYGFHLSIIGSALRLRRTDDFVWRFIAIAVPTLLLLDMAVVSYASKLSTMLLIMSVGWLERSRLRDEVPDIALRAAPAAGPEVTPGAAPLPEGGPR